MSKNETSASEKPIAAPAAEARTPSAKAGKRSPKAVKRAEQKQAKEERKATKDAPAAGSSKAAARPPRSRLQRAGKKFRAASELIDKHKIYGFNEAVELAIKTNPSKFDATVELHINLGVDPKQADQNVRDSLVLPAGSGKSLKLAAFVDGADVEKAKKAGADIAGADVIQAQLEKQEINFDVLIAPPALMPRLSKFARFLGPRGLMPNPKSGTVTNDIYKAISEVKSGRVEFRTDSNGIVHIAIGKTSFGADKISQNAQAVFSSIKAARPASLKGTYIKSAYITTTMGPGIRTELP